MKKVGIALLWIIAIVVGVLCAMMLVSMDEKSIQCPETIFCPFLALGWLSAGSGLLAVGLQKNWVKEKRAGRTLLLLSILLFLISKPVNSLFSSNSVIPLYLVGLFVILLSLVVPVCFAFSHMEPTERIDPYEKEASLILKTQIIDTSRTATARVKAGSALARGMVGEFVAGPIGGLAGAMSAKQRITEKTTISFLVYYKDGSKDIKEVDRNSRMCNVYLDKLDDSQAVI